MSEAMCRERANLSVQLKDTKTVVGRLETVIGIILHIVAIFIYLIIFDVSLFTMGDAAHFGVAWHTSELALCTYSQSSSSAIYSATSVKDCMQHRLLAFAE